MTANQDRKLSFLDIKSGKIIRTQSPTIEANDSYSSFISTITTDPSGLFIAAGSSDKSIRIIDFYTGASISQEFGHGDMITGLTFINDGRRVVSTSSDGCIMVWKIGGDVLKRMKRGSMTPTPTPPASEASSPIELVSPFVFNFDEKHLPGWARSNIVTKEESSVGDGLNITAKGRWAEVN